MIPLSKTFPQELKNPGLKSETWATHSMLVRSSFIFWGGLQAHEALRSGCSDEQFRQIEKPAGFTLAGF
jgi:hypothetical protein